MAGSVKVKAYTRRAPTRVGSTSKSTISKGFKNPNGMVIKNTPKIRKEVASYAHDYLRKLQGKK